MRVITHTQVDFLIYISSKVDNTILKENLGKQYPSVISQAYPKAGVTEFPLIKLRFLI